MIRIILLFTFLILTNKICLANNLIISEIYPNPKGTDSKKEWIEIYNPNNFDTNLNDWTIENKNKSVKIENKLIKPKSFLTITNLQISNENEKITLKHFNNIIDQVSFLSSTEDKSYTLTKIKNQDKQLDKYRWIWTSPSKNSPNPIIYEFTGKVYKAPEIKENYQFYILTKNLKSIKIIIDKEIHNIQFLKKTLKKDTQINILTKKLNNNFILQDYNIQSQIQEINLNIKKTIPDWTNYLVVPILILTIFIAVLMFYKTPL